MPPWDEEICISVTVEVTRGYAECLSRCRTNCSATCVPGGNLSLIPADSNSTHGLCYATCLEGCYGNCSSLANASVDEACVVPAEPVDYCIPPTGCTDDCGALCLDVTYLTGEGG